MTMYAISFAFANPNFICHSTESLSKYSSCTQAEFCSRYWKDRSFEEKQIDWKYNGSFTKKFMLICDDSSLQSEYLMLIQLLIALIPTIPVALSDTFGRKRTFKITAGILIIIRFTNLFFSEN